MAKMCQEMRFTHDQTNTDLPLLARIRRMITMIYHMGMSENSVPLNPMVNDHYPY